MDVKQFGSMIGLLAVALGIQPEDIISWLQKMGRRCPPGHGPVAEYLSMVLAPFNPQHYIIADNKRKTLIIGGPGTCSKTPNYKVEFAPELTTIGRWFQELKPFLRGELIIPESVVSIQDDAFFMMDIKRLLIEARIVELPGWVCCSCSSLTSVHLPDTLEKIGQSAFRLCNNLTDINIPDSVNTIERLAFEGCNALPEETKARILEIGGPEAFAPKEMTHNA